MKHKEIALTTWTLLKRTYHEFDDDNAIKLSASLSYYTIFFSSTIINNFFLFFSFSSVEKRLQVDFLDKLMVWLGIKQRFKFKKQSRISNLR
jgi:uncharacterized BrkB/YihY/UPF0761 family membrane protein